MTPELVSSIYDSLVPGWREAPLVGGHHHLRCPLHDDQHPSLDLHPDKLVWTCRAGCGAGGAWDLAVKLRGEVAARELLRQLDPPKGRSVLSTPRRDDAHVHTPQDSAATSGKLGLNLAAYATAIGCTREFLLSLGLRDDRYQGAPAVRIPYFDREGREIARRWRRVLERRKPDQRFKHRQGDKVHPYGLWRLAEALSGGSLVLHEGESDAHVCWSHGIHSLGIPGAESWRQEWATYLDGFTRLYAVQEPGQAGAAFVEKLARSLADRLYVVEMPDRIKDPRALLLDEPKRFVERFQQALADARPYLEQKRERGDVERAELWTSCQVLAERPSILDDFRRELPRLGVVGEDHLAQLIFLAVTSRLLDRPVSVAVKGPSSAGKSFTVERVLRFMPATAYYALSAMSERALAYSEEPLSHRVLVLYEAVGLQGDFATYLVRSLLSEGCVRYETVEKTPEGMRARLIERPGPTGLLLTTTAIRLHAENETRLLSVTTDDSRIQTKRVLAATALEDDELGMDTSAWQSLQAWLALGPRAVTVPYAQVLADLIPPVAVRLRRDFAQVLALIRAHALLHQATRERDAEGRIVATLDDYAVVRELVAPLIAEGVGSTVSATMRETVAAVNQLISEGSESVSVAVLAKRLKLDSSAASRRAGAAAELGFLTNLETKARQRARYVVGDPLPEDLDLLPEVEALRPAVGGVPVNGSDGETDAPAPLLSGGKPDRAREPHLAPRPHSMPVEVFEP